MKREARIGFIFVTLFIDILGIGLVIPILPKLVESLTGGDVANAALVFGWLGAVFSLMQFFFAPVLGALSDQYGRRPIILLSLLGLGLDYLVLATATGLPLFFLARVVAGMTSASITAASAYIADVSPPEKRAQNFGLIGAAFGLGFIAGPALGGLLSGFGLRVPFFVVAGLTLLNFLYGVFVLPESLAPQNRKAFSWARANPVGALGTLTKYPLVASLSVAVAFSTLAQVALQTTWALYTQYRYNWQPSDIGLSLAAVGLSVAVVQGGLIRVILPRLGERRAVIFGFAISVVSFVLYALAPQGWMLYVILLVGSLGGVAGPALQGMLSRNVAANEQGAVQGALSSVNSAMGFLGPLMATGVFAFFISPQAPVQIPGSSFFLGALFNVVALVLVVRSLNKHHVKDGPSGAWPDGPPAH